LSALKLIYTNASEALSSERKMWEGIELAAGMADMRVDQLVDLFKSEYWRRIEQRFNERVDGVQRGFEGLTHALDV